MTELRVEDLAAVRDCVRNDISRLEKNRLRRERLKPFESAMSETRKFMMTSEISDFMMDTIADSWKATLALEKSLREFPELLAKQEAKYETELNDYRLHTSHLREWLEALA